MNKLILFGIHFISQIRRKRRKISCERCVYESVDDRSLSYVDYISKIGVKQLSTNKWLSIKVKTVDKMSIDFVILLRKY